MAAIGGDPGGLCVTISALKVRFAICMHSSRVLRKVVHVDFTMFPVSIPAWKDTYKHAHSHKCPDRLIMVFSDTMPTKDVMGKIHVGAFLFLSAVLVSIGRWQSDI